MAGAMRAAASRISWGDGRSRVDFWLAHAYNMWSEVGPARSFTAGFVVSGPECETGPASAAKLARVGNGAVAQLGERCPRTTEVRGSIPLSSTCSDLMPTRRGAFPCDFFEISVVLVVNARRRSVGRRVPMTVRVATTGQLSHQAANFNVRGLFRSRRCAPRRASHSAAPRLLSRCSAAVQHARRRQSVAASIGIRDLAVSCLITVSLPQPVTCAV